MRLILSLLVLSLDGASFLSTDCLVLQSSYMSAWRPWIKYMRFSLRGLMPQLPTVSLRNTEYVKIDPHYGCWLRLQTLTLPSRADPHHEQWRL